MGNGFWARVDSGIVAEIITIPNGKRLSDLYTPSIVAQFVACDGSVRPNHLWNGSTFSAPPVPTGNPAATPAQMAQALAIDAGPTGTFMRGLVALLATRFGITPAEVITAIVNAAS